MTSPLREALIALGAQYDSSGEQSMPMHFGDPTREYLAARQLAALADRSAVGKIELRGPDRIKFLHGMCTNDIEDLPPGGACEAFFTDPRGKILSHARIYAGEDSLWIETAPGKSGPLIAHLDRYLITEKVEIADRTAQLAQVLAVGPGSRAILASIGDGSLAPDGGEVQECSIEGVPATLLRNNSLGLPGYEVRVAAPEAGRVWKLLCDAAQESGAQLLGVHSYEILRVEAGLPVYGVDIDESNLPQEIGRDDLAISYTKGCYIGQETVARISTYGHVNRHLVGLIMHERQEPPPRGSEISSGDRAVGHLTSSIFSYTLHCAIALGYVRRGNQNPGTELLVRSAGEGIQAQVHPLPFVPAGD